MEKIEKDFEGKKRKPDTDVTNLDESQKKGKKKKGRGGRKERKPQLDEEGNEIPIDTRGNYKVYELKSEKYEYYYKVFRYLY
jgi:hypothetical protein